MEGCCHPGGACTGACSRTRWECVGESNANAANGGGYCFIHGSYGGSFACPSCFTFPRLPEFQPLPAPPVAPVVINILESPPEGWVLVKQEKLERLGDTIDSLIEQLVDLLP